LERPRACIISFSPIADDPRVRRMGDALVDNGWDVVAIGLAGAKAAPPRWPVLEAKPPKIREPRFAVNFRWLAPTERVLASALAIVLGPVEHLLKASKSGYAARVSDIRKRLQTTARPVTRLVAGLRRRAAHLIEILSASPEERPFLKYWRLSTQLGDMRNLAATINSPVVWIANDWWALPVAIAGLEKSGGALAYDSHELATEEYAERAEWVKFQKPITQAIEKRYIKRAEIVTSVSPGITDHLRTMYNLNVQTITLRNTPSYRQVPFRPTGEQIRVLYHGVVSPGRGLEEAIDSVAQWQPARSLHIRGPAALPGYADSLRQRAELAGVADRVTFHPPVPMLELVEAAIPFDVGLMALPAFSLHTEYALPNKLFEYMMAGLALAVSDLQEMNRLVKETGVGVLISEVTADAIANAVNALTPSNINIMRRAALEAAKEFNWEAEAPPVINAYADLYNKSAAGKAA
jgi:glycosyltransferase involved in cell wall biosynthesis